MLETFYYDIISNYIRDKNAFINLMCVSKKLRNLHKKFRLKEIQINSPFVDYKLFKQNNGPKINSWYHLYIKGDEVYKTRPNGLYSVYVHSLNYQPVFRSNYQYIIELNLQSLNEEIFNNHSFYHMESLTKLILPKRLTKIKNKFQSCPLLKEIIMSDDVGVIKNSFTSNERLITITTHEYMFKENKPNILPSKLIKIKNSFNCCSILKTITFQENIKNIIDSFNYCDFQGTITIPKGLQIIDNSFEKYGEKKYNIILTCIPNKLSHFIFNINNEN